MSTTTDDYLSASNVDSSDLEFYDLSDSEDVPNTSSTNLDSVSRNPLLLKSCVKSTRSVTTCF